MSVTISKVDGVTMLTMTSDPDSLCPPLCQVLMGFCYSPLCYSVNRNMKRIQSKSLSVLGTLQFLIGLFHIGLGTILLCTGPGSWYQMDESFFPIWMGILFMVFGIMCVLMEKFPSPCLVFLHLVVHLCGAVFSIATIVLYSINLAHIRMWWMCREEHRYYYDATTMPSPAPQEETLLRQKCLVGKDLILKSEKSFLGCENTATHGPQTESIVTWNNAVLWAEPNSLLLEKQTGLKRVGN